METFVPILQNIILFLRRYKAVDRCCKAVDRCHKVVDRCHKVVARRFGRSVNNYYNEVDFKRKLKPQVQLHYISLASKRAKHHQGNTIELE